jgi:transposase-like protein
MIPACPNCHLDDPTGLKVVRNGKFYRRSTDSRVQRYRCKTCGKDYSDAIFEGCYRQKKRHLNAIVVSLLAHVNSQREVARMLKINFKTVVQKFRYQALDAEWEFNSQNAAKPVAPVVEFDDLETFEHSKHKPLSVALAVEGKTRRILAVDVAIMSSQGRLAKKAREKYGKRPDLRQKSRKMLFESLKPLVAPHAEIRTDCNPSYPFLVKKYFPGSTHLKFLGRRGCVTGQGELKEGKFDPLFSINHTCAMFRANVNRLIRKTWCTTKSADRLRSHLILYANEHNKRLDEMAQRERVKIK